MSPKPSSKARYQPMNNTFFDLQQLTGLLQNPMFGDGYDILIGSNVNTNHASQTYVGNTYQLPNGITDPFFLTGSQNFKVADYEVFQV